MGKNKVLLFLIGVCSVSFEVCAQKYAEGIVVGKNTGESIPYVNVYFKNYSYLGTISNLEGQFSLRMYDQPGDSVVFSHVGFKRKALSVSVFSSPVRIELEELEMMLPEVIIMPDSSLRVLLRKAFKNIESNYPLRGTLSEGFYRETNRIVGEKKFIYFSESTIEFYKPGYQNRSFGPVKIIGGGKAEVDSRRQFSNVYFYAGIYTPQSKDFVKQRAEFINPATFNIYDYAIEGVTNDGDREVISISFKPKADAIGKAEYTGKFQLDKKTLAYMGAQFELTDIGLKNHHRGILINIKNTRIEYDVRYREINGRWNFSSLVYDGELYNPRYKSYLQHTSEFVTTSVKEVDENPIKESEATSYTAIYTDQKDKFTDDYWKNRGTIVRDSILKEQVKELSLAREPPRQQKAISTLIRISSSFSVGVVPVTIINGSWSVNYSGLTIQRQVNEPSYLWVYDSRIGFRLNRSFSAFADITAQISHTRQFSSSRIGIDYRKRIVGWRSPFWFHVSAAFGPATLQQRLGKSEKVELFVGRSGLGIIPSVQLSHNIKPRIQIFAGASIYSAITTHDKLWMSEKKNFFSTKRTSAELSDPNVVFTIDGSQITSSPIHFRDVPTMFRVGLFLGVD